MHKLCMKIYYIAFVLILLVLGGCVSSQEASPNQKEMIVDSSQPTTQQTEQEIEQETIREVTDTISKVSDTNQEKCYDTDSEIACPDEGGKYYGQDAQYESIQASYRDNNDGTITDLLTGLTWTKQYYGKFSFDEGHEYVESLELAGYSDWRVPSIKELYSLIDFSGNTGSAGGQSSSTVPADAVPYVDTDYFLFAYGEDNERYIDSQWLTTAKYVSTTMNGAETMFGVNFADGRIKGYGLSDPRSGRVKKFYARFVRGDSYLENDFIDNGDDTITDKTSNLMWTKKDNGHYGVENSKYGGLNWQESLKYCEDLSVAGYSDWRLPNAKELQSIVDYTRSPATSNSPAIDPVFLVSSITDEAGNKNYPFYWTSTTHLEGKVAASGAIYVAFGEALGYMNGEWMDVHGAGAQRSDPKSGDPSNYPEGHGPQGDAIRIYNYVRCVRNGAEFIDVPLSVSSDKEVVSEPEMHMPPEGEMGEPGAQPPNEAIDACSGKSAGSSCSFNAPHGSVSGSCKNVGSTLACAP